MGEEYDMETTRPIRAVFFCGLAPSSVLTMTRWLAAGHEVAACVIASRQPRRYRRQENLRRWLVPEWSLTRVLARSQIPLIKAERTDLQSRLPDTMARFRADVLISDAFPYLIPSALTGVFPAGGVNLHPALLPHYRGPHPIQAMALDGAMETAGGVTLHCLSDRFDEGDIIAQLAISRSDAADMDALPMAMARVGAELLMTSLPRFCSGEIKPRPQTQALGRYARLMPEERVLTPDLTVEDIVLRARVLGPFGVLIVD